MPWPRLVDSPSLSHSANHFWRGLHMPESVETIIVGAGHGGLSVSCHLSNADHSHLVLERGEIGETWRSQRWDSFTVNSPNSLNQLPGDQSPLSDPDGFWHRDELLQNFESYASAKNLPVRTGVNVTGISTGPVARVLRLKPREALTMQPTWSSHPAPCRLLILLRSAKNYLRG